MDDETRFWRDLKKRNPLAAGTEAVPDLFAYAMKELRKDDDIAAHDFISALHHRGDIRAFTIAVEYCSSADALERDCGATVLGQLGYPKGKPFAERSFPHLERLLGDDDIRVVRSALIALAHLEGYASVLRHRHLAEHEDAGIRHAVAFALAGTTLPEAIDLLIEQTRDPDDRVRDWAAFALGTQCNVDTKPLRDALLACLVDACGPVRGEALVGLAKRGDQRVIPHLITEMTANTPVDHVLVAAGEIAAPELVPALEKLGKNGTFDGDVIDDLIRTCSGVRTLHEDD